MGLKRSILVIDDDPAVVDVLVDALSKSGYRVTSANDAMQAVIQAEGVKPAVVIMDIAMPHFGTGLDAYRNFRKIRELKEIPIIFFTGMKPSEAKRLVPTDDPKTRLMFKPISLNKMEQTIYEITR